MNGKECGRNWWKLRGSTLGRLRKIHQKSKSVWVSKWMKHAQEVGRCLRDTAVCLVPPSFRRNFLPPSSESCAHGTALVSVKISSKIWTAPR